MNLLQKLKYRLTHRPLPAEFWQALCVVHNHLDLHELTPPRFDRWTINPDILSAWDEPPVSFHEARQILDCWLDVAISEKWLD